MSLEAKRDSTITVSMDEAYAGKVERSLLRALSAIDQMDPQRRSQLVSTGTVDDLLALRLTLLGVLPGPGAAGVPNARIPERITAEWGHL